MKTIRQAGLRAASAAGSVLASKDSTKAEKSAAGSALSQMRTLRPGAVSYTSAAAASAAGSVLASKSSTNVEKSAAASALSRAPKKALQVICRVPKRRQPDAQLALALQVDGVAAAA